MLFLVLVFAAVALAAMLIILVVVLFLSLISWLLAMGGIAMPRLVSGGRKVEPVWRLRAQAWILEDGETGTPQHYPVKRVEPAA